MELYKLIATINNTSTPFTFEWLPENFDGVKIIQSFSFINPLGYTPKFSVETMRTINEDKWIIDDVFDAYGLESDVEIEIQKLKADATGYEFLANFAIDFESYEKFDFYSEFALKSISTIDFYNKIKNTEMQFNLDRDVKIPNTQKYINYVSLLYTQFIDSNTFLFEENNQSKIFNSDTALLSAFLNPNSVIYTVGTKDVPSSDLHLLMSFNLNLLFPSSVTNLDIVLVKNTPLGEDVIKYIFIGTVVSGEPVIVNDTFDINAGACVGGESFSIKTVQSVSIESGFFFVDIKRETNVLIVDSEFEYFKYVSPVTILQSFFDSITFGYPPFDYGITSANQIFKQNDFVNLKPKDFLSDYCLALGLMMNFKLDGSVYIDYMTSIFNSLLNTANAIEITDFKDVSIKHNTSLNFAGVSVGQEISDYEIYSYLIDWNKVLSFTQLNRNASENLDLTLQKLRGDFSGILDYFYKKSKQQKTTSKDNFIFNIIFNPIEGTTGLTMYDYFTPRDILNNWTKFLSFCFQNFSKDTLTISSNGGTVDNLNISGVNQMDDFVIDSTPRLLPIEYNLTGLIDNVDFSESIIKINHEGTDVYLFVFEAETTDKLTEQTIKGLKIQF